jgi:hypothetical protein
MVVESGMPLPPPAAVEVHDDRVALARREIDIRDLVRVRTVLEIQFVLVPPLYRVASAQRGLVEPFPVRKVVPGILIGEELCRVSRTNVAALNQDARPTVLEIRLAPRGMHNGAEWSYALSNA